MAFSAKADYRQTTPGWETSAVTEGVTINIPTHHYMQPMQELPEV